MSCLPAVFSTEVTGLPAAKDLVVLVPDSDMESTVRGLLSRAAALGIRLVEPKIYVDRVGKDPGCLLHAHDFLRSFSKLYAHALVMFDRHGCGREDATREQLEREVEARLAQSGWRDRAAAVVLDPELEIWIWSDLPHVSSTLGWSKGRADLNKWLQQRGFLPTPGVKPSRPKLAWRAALRVTGRSPSPSLFLDLARRWFCSPKLAHFAHVDWATSLI